MKPVSDIFPWVLPHVIGCPEPLAAQAVTDYAIAFCEDSLAIRQRLDGFSTVSGTAQYTLTQPTDQLIARVLDVWVDNAKLSPVASNVPAPPVPELRRPEFYYTTRSGSVTVLNLYPTPDSAYTVVVDVALRPVRGAATLQDDLFDVWLDVLVSGALGRLMSTPNQPFSDPAYGAVLAQRALSLSRKARIDSGIGRVITSQSVKPRPMA